jgi:putative DNA primase/helicase
MSTERRNLFLETAGEDLVRRLGGQWDGSRGMCRCPAHKDRSPSLSVRVGDRSLLFKCFAGCDTTDVLRELRLMRLAVPTDPSASVPATTQPQSDRMRDRAREIWDEARPITGGPAARYLLSRGLATFPASLRYHPRTPFGRGRTARYRPAIVAAVAEPRRFTGLQRLFIEPDGSSLATDLEKPKWGLARPLGGAVQLAPAGPVLGLAEGVETAMSAAFLLGIPVWAALGGERLHQILIPSVVRRLILLPDSDRAGRIAVPRAQAAYADCAFDLGLEWPWANQNDWNDVLQRPVLWEGKGAEERVRLAA